MRAKSEDNLCVVVTIGRWMYVMVSRVTPVILKSERYDVVVHQSGSPEISSRLLCYIFVLRMHAKQDIHCLLIMVF